MGRKQGKRNLRKREKKRRQERARRARRQMPAAYVGRKYQTEELMPVHLFTESGIFRADLLARRRLTDAVVESALQRLILEVRRASLDLEGQKPAPTYSPGQEEDLVVACILYHWGSFSRHTDLPSRDTLVGVLRTILGSIDVHKIGGAMSRGYLQFLEGFLNQMNLTPEKVFEIGEPDSASEDWEDYDEDEEDLDEDEEAYEDEREDSLVTEIDAEQALWLAGMAWHKEDDPEAETAFREIAEGMIESGRAADVIRVCQGLSEQAFRPSIKADLTAVTLVAENALSRAQERD